MRCFAVAAALAVVAATDCGPPDVPGLRSSAFLGRDGPKPDIHGTAGDNDTGVHVDPVDVGELSGRFVLRKRYNLAKPPTDDFDIAAYPDANLTHSCANYIDDGSTVFSRDGQLVLRVASNCDGGGCLNSGRVMSKESFRYGLFTFSARVPKCNFVWPAIWLLPEDKDGHGVYGRWPCSGEIDILETVHNTAYGTFNLVAGYGSTGGCKAEGAAEQCNECIPSYCTSTTMSDTSTKDRYFVEEPNCDVEHPSWHEHTFVLNWQPGHLTTWVDPKLTYDAEGHLVAVQPRTHTQPKAAGTNASVLDLAVQENTTWRVWKREHTPTWQAVGNFMDQCFQGKATQSAPFDDAMKIVLNVAVGGYGGSACSWGSSTCQTACGGAVGSELILSDISVWEYIL